MLRNRQDGLVSLHGIWVTLLTTAAFFVFTWFTQVTGWMKLTPGFNQSLYLLAAFIGMLVGARVYLGWVDKLARLSWSDSVYVTFQQVARMALVLFGVAFAIKDANVSRVFLGSYLCLIGVGLVFANRYLPRLIAKFVFKSNSIPTIIVGSGEHIPGFEKWLHEQAKLGVDVLGHVVKQGDRARRQPGCLGEVSQIASILENHPATQLVLPLFYLGASETKHVMSVARESGCRVRLVESLQEDSAHHFTIERSESGVDVIDDGDEPLENPVNRTIKRLFDIAVALPVVLFVLPPLTLLVWIAQKLQAPGPVFFRQVRYGEGRKTFLIFKFRTMYVASQNATTERVQATKGDSRIYPFGRFMRKTSLDEFPQFLNVLFGEMSVSGPRPHLVQHDNEFARLVADYRMRHFVKPGITGLAQSHGYRGEITNSGLLFKRVQHDIAYVRSWTPIMDLQILARTALQVVFPPKSAY